MSPKTVHITKEFTLFYIGKQMSVYILNILRFCYVNSLLSAIPESQYSSFVKNWTIVVVEDPNVVNAMAIPGGYIVVFTGILDKFKSDDMIANVLAHEISHVLLRHGAQAMSFRYIEVALISLLAIFFDIPVDFARVTSAVGFNLPFSRSREEEADYYGLLIAAGACFDPEEAVGFWRAMQTEDSGDAGKSLAKFTSTSSLGNILSTHPMHERRIQLLQQAMPEAHSRREANNCQDGLNNNMGRNPRIK